MVILKSHDIPFIIHVFGSKFNGESGFKLQCKKMPRNVIILAVFEVHYQNVHDKKMIIFKSPDIPFIIHVF